MTQLNQIYKCHVCGNIVEVVHAGAGELVCCGQPMELQKEKTEDEGQEKHIPVIEQSEGGVKVKVGFVDHPMEDAHYIEWIEISVDSIGLTYRQTLKPDSKPIAVFPINDDNIKARAYCNIHGLWQSK